MGVVDGTEILSKSSTCNQVVNFALLRYDIGDGTIHGCWVGHISMVCSYFRDSTVWLAFAYRKEPSVDHSLLESGIFSFEFFQEFFSLFVGFIS